MEPSCMWVIFPKYEVNINVYGRCFLRVTSINNQKFHNIKKSEIWWNTRLLQCFILQEHLLHILHSMTCDCEIITNLLNLKLHLILVLFSLSESIHFSHELFSLCYLLRNCECFPMLLKEKLIILAYILYFFVR